ncbi:MAG: hypothetical protein LBS31_10290, partial [Candidatus Adiutrix sp.]|nr:hypothetical protein [Candidatus Adiutrix sp.]
DAPDFNRAFEGKEGWLFIGNSEERATDKLTGLMKPRRVNRRIEQIREGLARYESTPRFFFLGPAKSSVYGEHLPDFVRPAPVRYSESLLETLRQGGLAVYDPTAALLKAKARGLLYYKTDTHWNALGASVAVEGFIDYYNRQAPPEKQLRLPPYALVPGPPFKGNLIGFGNFIYLKPEAGDNFKVIWLQPVSKLKRIDENGERLAAPEEMTTMPFSNHPFTIINPNAASDLRVWLFRDSFSSAMAPFLHSVFAETRHIFKHDLFTGMKGTDSSVPLPDLIIYEIVELDL